MVDVRFGPLSQSLDSAGVCWAAAGGGPEKAKGSAEARLTRGLSDGENGSAGDAAGPLMGLLAAGTAAGR